jgi:hypothetical protein
LLERTEELEEKISGKPAKQTLLGSNPTARKKRAARNIHLVRLTPKKSFLGHFRGPFFRGSIEKEQKFFIEGEFVNSSSLEDGA